MSENPLAEAIAKLQLPPPPVFKVVGSAFVELDKLLIIDPIASHMPPMMARSIGISEADLERPGLKVVIVPLAKAAEVKGWVRDLGFDLLDD